MILRTLAAAAIGASIGAGALSSPVDARSLGTVDGLPFFGHPYPYGYVYHRPPEQCINVQRIEQPFAAPLIEVTWVCGGPVTARY